MCFDLFAAAEQSTQPTNPFFIEPKTSTVLSRLPTSCLPEPFGLIAIIFWTQPLLSADSANLELEENSENMLWKPIPKQRRLQLRFRRRILRLEASSARKPSTRSLI